MTFNELNLIDELQKAVNELGFEQAMPVQSRVIPFVIDETADLVALAQTGTGKTAAFGLPILQLVNADLKSTQALVLAPTRELCIQISKDLKDYAKYIPALRVVPVYGGEDIRKQLKELDRTPQVIVATPGRLIDLMERRKVKLDSVEYLVLDEADEMLNMGFKEEIERILTDTPETRRTMMFSATMPDGIRRISQNYMKDFVEISVGERNAGTANVKHIYYMIRARNRYLALKRIVDHNPDIYGIVFCRTRQETKDVADKLMRDGYNADALHGDLSQPQRDNVMQKFRIRNIQLLVATDVAARGLDVDDLSHVINYNLPDDVEIYTHRSGRTGRANKTGVSISLIHTKEKFKIKAAEKTLKQKFEQQRIPNGLEICSKQLFYQINRMQHVAVNEEQIEPFMAQITSQLEYLSKEELLKRFVSLEFNRFLDYYKNAEDLNVDSDHGNEDEGGRNRRKSGKRVNMKINVGSKDGMNPARILGIINSATNDKSISVGGIEIAKNYSFFEVFEDQRDKILQSFDNLSEFRVAPAKGGRAAGRAESYMESAGRKSRPQGRGRENGEYRRKKTNQQSQGYSNSEKPWRRGRR